MLLGFAGIDDSALIVGRTPWSARVPRTRSSPMRSGSFTREEADEGVGRRPGGPPHDLCLRLALALGLAHQL